MSRKNYDDATLVPDQNEPRALQTDGDEPLALADACKLFPHALLTVSILRAEATGGLAVPLRLWTPKANPKPWLIHWGASWQNSPISHLWSIS
jgi:hypothetical protein